jgi:hypothetical protein
MSTPATAAGSLSVVMSAADGRLGRLAAAGLDKRRNRAQSDETM